MRTTIRRVAMSFAVICVIFALGFWAYSSCTKKLAQVPMESQPAAGPASEPTSVPTLTPVSAPTPKPVIPSATKMAPVPTAVAAVATLAPTPIRREVVSQDFYQYLEKLKNENAELAAEILRLKATPVPPPTLQIVIATPTPIPTPTPTPAPKVLPGSVDFSALEIARLQAENARLRQEIASLKAASVLTPTPAPVAIVWPIASKIITGGDARVLLTNTFPNRRMTGAHFNEAALYTLEQFKEIRSKMALLADNHLPWPSTIDKALGTFQEPGIENLPVGWAYPTYDSMYLITILYDGGRSKIFGFDPFDKAKIWEVTSDPRVEAAIVR